MSQKFAPFSRCARPDAVPDCCIDTYRVYDSCIGQECMRNLYLCLTDTAQAVVNQASGVRVKALSVVWAQILTEPIPFQSGYYNVTVRYYLKADCEACVGAGQPQDFSGLSCYTKNVILYGGEGNIFSFRSDDQQSFCSPAPGYDRINRNTNSPRVTVDVASPVALESTIVADDDPTIPACCQNVPEEIAALFDGDFHTGAAITNCVFLTAGLFTTIRLSRPVLLKLENGSFYFPEKTADGVIASSDPCTLFTSMPFPYNEFSPAVIASPEDAPGDPPAERRND